VLIDPRQPMSYTSAQSGDNYRNWWPHPVMTAFTNDSIDELDRLARDSNDVFNMMRGGYVLATRREDISELSGMLQDGVDVDFHERASIVSTFPYLADDIHNVIHIRRGGDISGQQLGAWMLAQVREAGGKLLRGKVQGIERSGRFKLLLDGEASVHADIVINAAGPFADHVAGMLGEALPVKNIFQQKIAFEDRQGAIARDMPFSIDLDDKQLDWSDEERALLSDDPDLAWLAKTMPGGTHCRPDGGPNGKWVKLGWAYNEQVSEPREDLANEPTSDPQFPEIVMRGAAAFVPALKVYVDNPPTRYSHYGGYYTMTEENWPLVGPMQTEGAYMVAALSGFGSMAACAAGKLCAAHACGGELPGYAAELGTARYDDEALMAELRSASSKGVL